MKIATGILSLLILMGGLIRPNTALAENPSGPQYQTNIDLAADRKAYDQAMTEHAKDRFMATPQARNWRCDRVARRDHRAGTRIFCQIPSTAATQAALKVALQAPVADAAVPVSVGPKEYQAPNAPVVRLGTDLKDASPPGDVPTVNGKGSPGNDDVAPPGGAFFLPAEDTDTGDPDDPLEIISTSGISRAPHGIHNIQAGVTEVHFAVAQGVEVFATQGGALIQTARGEKPQSAVGDVTVGAKIRVFVNGPWSAALKGELAIPNGAAVKKGFSSPINFTSSFIVTRAFGANDSVSGTVGASVGREGDFIAGLVWGHRVTDKVNTYVEGDCAVAFRGRSHNCTVAVGATYQATAKIVLGAAVMRSVYATRDADSGTTVLVSVNVGGLFARNP